VDLKQSIDDLNAIMKSLCVLDHKADEVFGLAKAYLSDSEHFFNQGNAGNALEAYAIAWAYIDALLHLELVSVTDKSIFTVDE
jgi:hypothetical protein